MRHCVSGRDVQPRHDPGPRAGDGAHHRQLGQAGDINDFAVVTSTTPDPNLSNNQAEGRVSVSGAADLGLVKVDSPDPLVAADRQITYTLTVTSSGPSTAQNVRVRDVVGAGQEIVSVSAPTGSCVIGVPGNAFLPTVCTFDSMAPSTQKVMTIVVRVPNGVLSTAQNDARVSSETFDPNNANDLASTQTTISIADVEILKTSDFDVYKPSSTVKYIVRVMNHGPASARGSSSRTTSPTSSRRSTCPTRVGARRPGSC